MNSAQIDTGSLRASKARLAKSIGPQTYRILVVAGAMIGLVAICCGFFVSINLGIVLVSPTLASLALSVWWKRDLSVLPAEMSEGITGRLSVDVLARVKPGVLQNSQQVWSSLSDHWQSRFVLNHLMLPVDLVSAQLSDDPAEFQKAMQLAQQIADQNHSQHIELGFVVSGLLLASPKVNQLLVSDRAKSNDIAEIANWLARGLADSRRAKQKFGGVGRDWAFGFTPLLDRMGQNLSMNISKHGAHYGWLTGSEGVKAIEAAFDNHAVGIALIGPDGIGKTNTVHALAQRLIEGTTTQSLAYHQIVALNATDIVSASRGPGGIERVMISLANEASHAGHIILFFDNAQMFFGDGPGSFDAGQILLSILEARTVPLILAFTPNDFQRLKTHNGSLANRLTPVVLQELPESGVMRVLEDTAVGLENKNKVMIAYEALREAYRLSGRYEQDEAYPGKAIKLLEQSIPHSQNSIVSASSVQQAIEQTRGVKVSSAAPVEANQLLNLEQQIHQRMINQSHAVGVVASALRRARAGVTNPKRPIGSFLFLGPTGVGKTELAKAVAATYFRSESSMIRLDMSEFQQPDDVQRLLSTGAEEASSLLMRVRQQPFTVVLLDEIEKAHPNILNLLLQMLDEGQLTDSSGRVASFKDSVIIATSNAGATTIRDRIAKGEELENFAAELTDELIKGGQFKPELLNRFDETVLFRPLTNAELAQVVRLMMADVNKTLTSQNITVDLTDAAVQQIVEQGNDPRLGARPMRRELQRTVENTLAQKILKGEARPGDKVTLDAPELTQAS